MNPQVKRASALLRLFLTYRGSPLLVWVESLRSLDFSNLANWNILVAEGREINRDPVSSSERVLKHGIHQNKREKHKDYCIGGGRNEIQNTNIELV
jgi:hypothetical protein